MIIVLWLSLLLFIITYFGIDVIIIVLLFLLLFLLIIIIMTIIVFFNKRLCSFPALVLHPQKMASFIKPRWPLSKTSLMNSYWCSDYSYKIFDFFKEVCLLWIKKKRECYCAIRRGIGRFIRYTGFGSAWRVRHSSLASTKTVDWFAQYIPGNSYSTVGNFVVYLFIYLLLFF